MKSTVASLKELQTIPGIGKSIAQDLIGLGYHSVSAFPYITSQFPKTLQTATIPTHG